MGGPSLETERLILRPWRESDLAPFAEINADREVMTYLPGLLSRAESDAQAAHIRSHFDHHGYCFWAVEERKTGRFVGFNGLGPVEFKEHFTPAVQAGWRMARPFWGKGYATEAARAALAHGFDEFGMKEIVAYTVPANGRSRAVMERLGMTQDQAGDFDHPKLPEGHPLRRHVLYRIARPPLFT
jgi:RimJ/RimL family protein N-acetyltransferase